jgi:hypothetical protein
MAGKLRSPNYPALSLRQALDAAEKLWKAEKRTPVSHEAAATGLGFKSLSGPARVTIGALRQYGLVDKAEKGHIKLSELAVRVLHGNPDDKEAALQQAATSPNLFKELARLHADGSEAAIQSYLITKKEFAEDGARKAAKAFRETRKLAKQDASGYTPDDEQETPEDMPDIDAGQKDASGSGTDGKGSSGVLSMTVPYGGQGNQLTVQIRVTGERLKRSHIAKVRRYLEIAEEDLENGGNQ